jgi:hypothetical protein
VAGELHELEGHVTAGAAEETLRADVAGLWPCLAIVSRPKLGSLLGGPHGALQLDRRDSLPVARSDKFGETKGVAALSEALVFVVAGARNHLQANYRSVAFDFEIQA